MSILRHDPNLIFIHIPKTAGTSMEKLSFIEGIGHRPIRAFQDICVSQKMDFKSYFKFAFVRNPFDRMVSAFFNSTEDITFDDKADLKFDRTKESFTEFLTVLDTYNLHKVKIDLYDYVYPKYRLEEWPTHPHFIPQHCFVCDKRGRLVMDFIGRFEDLDSDWARVCIELGQDEKLGHHRKSNHLPWKSYYTEETKEIVRKIYKKDFEMFGY
jgi:hypothetical protein